VPRMMKKTSMFRCIIAGLFSISMLIPWLLRGDQIKLQVTAEQANIRERPDIMSAVLQQVSLGTTLEAERKEGEWYAVKVEQEAGGHVFGFVHESLVKVLQSPLAKTPQPLQPPVKEKPVEQVREVPRIPPPVVTQPSKGRSSVSLWYGERYATVGDLNDGARGLSVELASKLGVSDPNKVGSIHFGRLYGAEFRYPLVRGLELAVGGEYFSGERASTVTYKSGTPQASYETTPRVRVIPLSASLLLYPAPYIYIKTGLDFSLARCDYYYRFENGDFWQEWQGQADAVGLGYLLGVGAEWRLFGGVHLVIEGAYRNSRIGNLDGEETYRESGKPDTQTKGTLYFVRSGPAANQTVSLVFIHADTPGGNGVVEARKAELSLSGLSLRAGLKIAF
jgi:hypothetical protein